MSDHAFAGFPTSTTATKSPISAVCIVHDYSTIVPAEILAQIFLLASERFPDSNPCVTARIVSQVCSRWRTIALESKELWSYMPIQLGEQWLRLALERSDPYPISLNGFSGTTRWQAPDFATPSRWGRRVLLVLKEFHRIRNIQLSLFPFFSEPGTQGYFVQYQNILETASAPELQRFIVAWPQSQSLRSSRLFSGSPLPQLVHWETQSIPIPPDIGDGIPPPKLQFLRTSFSKLRTSPLLRSPLTVLQLSSKSQWRDDFSTLLDVLCTLSSLKVLEFEDLAFERSAADDGSWSQHPRKVALPNLCQLSWQGKLHVPSGFAVLRHLVFPPTANIRIHATIMANPTWPWALNTYPNRSAEAVSLITSLQCLSGEPDRASYRTVSFQEVEHGGRGSLNAHFTPDDIDADASPQISDCSSASLGYIDLSLMPQSDDLPHEDIALRLLASIPFKQVSTINFSHTRLFDSRSLTVLRSSRRHFFCVTSVCAHGVAARGLLRALTVRPPNRFLCDLEEVVISGVLLSPFPRDIDEVVENHYADMNPESPRAMETMLACFLSALASRKEKGVPIQRLRIQTSAGVEELLGQLSDLVKDVRVEEQGTVTTL